MASGRRIDFGSGGRLAIGTMDSISHCIHSRRTEQRVLALSLLSPFSSYNSSPGGSSGSPLSSSNLETLIGVLSSWLLGMSRSCQVAGINSHHSFVDSLCLVLLLFESL